MLNNGIKLLVSATMFVGLTFVGLALSAQTTTPATPPPSAVPQAPSMSSQPTPQDQAHQAIEKIGTDLNLTADQKTKLEPIIANEIQQVRDLRADTTMTPEQKQAKYQETLTADHVKIDSILTPEQKQKLAELRQQQAQSQSQPPAPSQQPPAAPPASPQSTQPPK
jgi:Spy/CpxP family protein refolding chaperone